MKIDAESILGLGLACNMNNGLFDSLLYHSKLCSPEARVFQVEGVQTVIRTWIIVQLFAFL